MVIVAHPGDEAFGFGGAIAQSASMGAYVVVVCATRGRFDPRLVEKPPAPGGRNRHYSNPVVWRNLDTVREVVPVPREHADEPVTLRGSESR